MAVFLRLLALVVGVGTVPAAEPFEMGCLGHGFELRVTSTNEPGASRVRIEPSGLAAVNDPIEFDHPLPLREVLFEDMNGDGIEEVALVFAGGGSGSRGTARAFSTNGAKSLTEIVIEEPAPEDLEGYAGGDEFQIMENTFVRRFPVHQPGDEAANPSGGMRQFQYKLRAGEASWHLRLDRVVSY